MEQRKLIRLGNSSFAIALPKDWVDKSGLKKGDSVFIERNSNGELLIMPDGKITEQRIININLNKDNEDLKREISAAYVKGYDVFKLNGKPDKEKTNFVKKVLEGLLGIEMIENNGDGLVTKDFFNISEVNQENFIRRMDNNIREAFDLILESLDTGKWKNIDKEIKDIDQDINKFYLLSSRVMFKGAENLTFLSKLKTSPRILFNNWWFAFNLEHIGDELKSIAKILKKEKIEGKKKETVIRLISQVKNIYVSSLEAFYKKDKQLALKIIEEGKKVWDECDKLYDEKDPMMIRIAVKLKNLETASYQNIKMVLYVRS